MSRRIVCPECNKRLSALASRYNELYESIKGKSKCEFFCDDCVPLKPIHKGDTCFAAVLLPNKNHFNYEIQKPENWLKDFITV
jgi:uncharacterized protein YbaR (Trm112 family)